MPLYEYANDVDHERLELLRSSADADKPVTDPAGKGRVFTRVFSTFAAKGSGPGASGSGDASSPRGGGGCCPCGKPGGSCSRS